MELSHETHVSDPAVLDNSHYVSETLVSTNAATVQSIFAFVNRSSTSNSPVQLFTPRTRGRLMDEDFGDVRYGDIRASDAQIITTRRIKTVHSPELPASQSPSQEVASQDQLLQLRAQYDAAELLAKTAEAEARAARARKMTQQLDLETRAQALRSNSSSPRASPTASSPRAWSPPAPSQQGTDLAAVLLHLEAQRRNDALQRQEERRS